jgi:hypothetical protein
MTADDGLREIRVHGVGGPQAPKILGVLHESDVETLRPAGPPAGLVSSPRIFFDGRSRLVRPLGSPAIAGYEWGALTLGSLLNAMWVVYLPLTFLNVSGWSQRAEAGPRNRSVVNLLCGLGTLTYVGWIGYVVLDLMGRQWRDHIVSADIPQPLADAVRCGALPLAHAIFVGILGALWWVNRRSGSCFESARLREQATTWDEADDVVDPAFFSHEASYRRLRRGHEGLALVGALAVVLLGFIPRKVPHGHATASLTSVGLALIVLATVQGVVVLLLWLTCPWVGSVPQCVFATVGTLLCHAAFAGLAITVRDRLASWPKVVEGGRPVVSGAELGFADFFFVALAAAAVLVAAFVLIVALSKATTRGYPPRRRPALVTAVVRRANTAGTLVSLSFVGALTAIVALKVAHFHLHADPSTWWASTIVWYQHYETRQNAAQKLGGLALVGLFLVLIVVLRRPRTSAAGRVVGNIWDVLTFWPRRFHPFGVPPYSERAVPELRWVIRQSRRPSRPLVIAGHSQGSVLAFAAVAQELRVEPAAGPVCLLTFGSPLGGLFARAFPAYFGPSKRSAVASAVRSSGGRWWNLYRSTDAIGGPVLGDADQSAVWFDKWLPDPRGTASSANHIPPEPRPLERAQPWFARNGHGFYLADPASRQMLAWLHDGTAASTADLENL